MLVRNPDLLVAWKDGRVLVRELEGGKSVVSSADLFRLLDKFTRPRAVRGVLAEYAPAAGLNLRRLIQRLRKLKFLLPVRELHRRQPRIQAWNHNLASLQYHLACRDMNYLTNPEGAEAFLSLRVASGTRPPLFTEYPSKPRRSLPRVTPAGESARLRRILETRRTVREFRKEAVSLRDFSQLVRGTWGRTGWLDGGAMGRLPIKTSPSAGSLHPVECYILAWNVRGLPQGLYHYDVPSDCLRQLRRGDFRKQAARVAAGQTWVQGAAFLCVMTAAFERTLWKYEHESAYRVVWMDAGHLGQTFCLIATSLGLGPFTTAALADTFTENLLGIDGIREFPVYLCGAGVPLKRRQPDPTSRTSTP